MSVPTNWDAAGQGIQDEIDALSPVASAASTSLSAIPAATLDGKAFMLTIAGRSGAGTVNLKVNGTTFFSFGTPGSGYTFLNQILLVFSSANQDLWSIGSPSLMSSFNPSTLTFSTDASHTVTSFTLRLV